MCFNNVTHSGILYCKREAVDSATETIDPMLMRAKARVGRTLRGKWRLDVLLGVGGMAAVYAGTHRNGARAAIKVLHPELCAHTHIRSRFFREGRIANTIPHDGTVKVLDEDQDESGSMFLVMELLDGENLDSRATRAGGTLAVNEVLAIADQLLDVLVAAHDKGVIHRDLKPENVFLTRDGCVRVLDFGIARLRELSTQSNMTRDGSMMGTPAFMPPEQARGLWDEVDERADIWAVGATMFSLITGRPVHDGRTTNDVLVAAVTQNATPLAEATQGVPAPVAALVDRALAFEKAERWPHARAMQDALRHAFHSMHGTPISSHPRPTVPETVPNRTLPSAGIEIPATLASVGTGPAVASGKTGVPLRVRTAPGVSRAALLAAGVVAMGGLVGLLLLLFGAVSQTGGPIASAEPSADNVGTAANRESRVGTPINGDDAGGVDKNAEVPAVVSRPTASVIALDDLPIAAPSATLNIGGRRQSFKPPLGPRPTPRPPATSWKEQRQ